MRTMGMLVPDVSNPFFSSIVQLVETLLYDAGYTCYICDTYNDSERTKRYLRGLAQRQADGLVFVSGDFDIEALNPLGTMSVLLLDAMTTKRCA